MRALLRDLCGFGLRLSSRRHDRDHRIAYGFLDRSVIELSKNIALITGLDGDTFVHELADRVGGVVVIASECRLEPYRAAGVLQNARPFSG
jgi:hypothetical protein